jgi:type IV pilus assembly protein PilQ
MIPLIPLLAAALSLLTSVNGLALKPVSGRTDVVIRVDGQVTIKDYRLGDPERLVIDLNGAQKAISGDRFDNLDRGGVKGIRVSQFQPEVVRVVVDLEQRVDYAIDRRANEIHVSFANPGGDFEPWSVGESQPVARAVQRTPAAPAAPAAPAPAPPARLITATFEKTPILDVLSTFSDFSGKSIVAGQGITGDVTATINQQPWDVALDAILRAQGLSSQEQESGIIQVEKLENMRDREKNEDLVTKQFKIRYVAVDSMSKAIEGLKSERGKVTTSPSTNTLIITDGRSVIQRIEPMIQQLDVRTPQVTIQAKIMFVDRTALEDMGVIYDLKDSRGNQINSFTPGFLDQNGDGVLTPDEQTGANVISLGGSSIAALANATSRVEGAALQVLTSLVLGRHTLLTFIEALQSLTLSDIQAAPVVTVMDNRDAKIQVGEETPIRVVDVGAVSQGAGAAAATGGLVAPRATVQMKNTGVILNVTPHVTGDHILLDLHAERSNVVPGAGDAGVAFQQQIAETQVLVKDGETAVVGGLTLIEKTRTRTGIPVLMDVPVLGALFRHTTDSEHKRDLLIMVTPHILNAGA